MPRCIAGCCDDWQCDHDAPAIVTGILVLVGFDISSIYFDCRGRRRPGATGEVQAGRVGKLGGQSVSVGPLAVLGGL